jgi:3-methyladenine DNA glycosylase AlkD
MATVVPNRVASKRNAGIFLGENCHCGKKAELKHLHNGGVAPSYFREAREVSRLYPDVPYCDMTAASVMAELKKKGTAQTRKIYGRHGMDPERVFGVSSADMKLIAKSIKGQQALAMQLYKTGIMEAMYVAGMVASGAKMSAQELQSWAEGSDGLQMIAEHTVPWVTVENACGAELAVRWMASTTEHVAVAGWSSYSGMVATKADGELNLKEIERLLGAVTKGIGKAKNRERYCMNRFVISAGSYVAPMAERAKAVAREIGVVKVDMGETACKVPLALEAIEKASGSAKKKTIRC